METMVKNLSPRIKKHEWGKLWLEDYQHAFKDAKLYPGGAREWDWNETGTRHSPGIQIADAQELVEKGADTVILSTGVYERLHVPKATVQYLQNQGVKVTIAQTENAVEQYNNFVKNDHAVGGLFHSTC